MADIIRVRVQIPESWERAGDLRKAGRRSGGLLRRWAEAGFIAAKANVSAGRPPGLRVRLALGAKHAQREALPVRLRLTPKSPLYYSLVHVVNPADVLLALAEIGAHVESIELPLQLGERILEVGSPGGPETGDVAAGMTSGGDGAPASVRTAPGQATSLSATQADPAMVDVDPSVRLDFTF